MPARLEEEYEYEDFLPEIELEPEPPKQRLVPPPPPLFPKPKLAHRLRKHARIIFLMMTALAMVITIRSGIAASHGYELVKLQREVQQMEQENERLRMEISHLKTPQRIKAIATGQLGMEMPKKIYFSRELTE